MTDMAVGAIACREPGWTVVAGETDRSRALRAEVLAGPGAYRQLAADWHRLAELQAGAVLFQTPELLDCWARHFATDRSTTLETIVVRKDDGHPVLIWPLLVERNAVLRIARGAGSPVGQYDDILLDPDCDPAAAYRAATEALMRAARPDVIVLERVRADGALHAAIGDAAPLGAGEAAPYSDVSKGAAELMASLKGRVVRQQKKRVRRFEQEGEVGFEVADAPADAVRWLDEAIELKRGWLRSTGRFSRAFLKYETTDCLAELARSLSGPEASPRMLVSRLTLDGQTAAVEMGFCHRGVYHLYLGAFAEPLAKFGPGNILTEKLLGWCAAHGVRRYDMLAPRSRNKAEWQSGEVAVLDFALPTTLRGRLYVSLVLRRLFPAMRRGFYALPAPVRSTVAGLALRNLGNSGRGADASDEAGA